MRKKYRKLTGMATAIAGTIAISSGVFAVAAPVAAAPAAYISQASAKSAALKHAGVSASQISNYEIEFDKEKNGVFYEVEFDAKGYEYDYKIDANNGTVVKVEKKALKNKTDVVNKNGTWTYVVNNKPDYSYTGFAKNNSGWWYIEKGKVTFRKNSVVYGTVNGVKAWWNVKGSNVKFNNSVEQNEHGWWVIRNGKVDFGYTGFAKNNNGWWYIEKGNVTFKKNSVIYGTVNGVKAWWNVKGSNVKFNNSVEQNEHGWWVIRNGKVDFGYTGFAKNNNGWWYIEKGNVTFKKNGNIKGTVNGKNSTWIVKKSHVEGEVKNGNSNTNTNTNTNTGTNYIGIEKAKSIALKHAGLSVGQVRELKGELDRENGVYVYEVDFKSGKYEYEYDINATTGNIIKSKKEID